MRLLSKIDWPLIISFVLLTGFGLTVVYSLAFPRSELSFFYKQFLFLGLGLILMLGIVAFFDYRRLRSNSLVVLGLYSVLIVLLAGLFFFPSIRGIHGWYRLGPLTFDPVPFAQLGLIIILAKYFSIRHPQSRQLPLLLLSSVYAILPAILVFFQPDFGSAIVFILIWLGLILISGLKWRHLLFLFFCFLVLGSLIWGFALQDYQKNRVMSFIHPSSSEESSIWQPQQSQIALGSGGWLGRGWGNNSQARYGFLPEAKTDFIFSAIAEEFGFLGIIILGLLFFILIWRLVKIGGRTEDNFAYLLTLGYLIWITSQSFISIGMNVGFLPVIGIPLPLVSYGGSSLIAFYLGGGLVMSTRSWSA